MRPPRRSLSALCSITGAIAAAVALFLPWSHQLPATVRHRFNRAALYGIPAHPTAFEVYAIAGEVLALAALLSVAAGLWGRRSVCATATIGAAVGLAFSAHALASAPTNGLLLAVHGRAYLHDPATPGGGETLAVIGFALALVGALGGLAPRSGTGRIAA